MHRDIRTIFRNRFGLDRQQSLRARRRRATRLEILEDRTLLAASATLDIAAGTLSYALIGGPMDLSVSVDASDVYTFQDPSQTITLGAGASGWTLSADGHTATGPAASFSQIAVIGDGSAFNDAVTIHSTNAPTTISTGAGDDVFTFDAPAIKAAVTLTNPLSGGGDGDVVHFLTEGVAGTLATGQKGRESYQAAGGGLINITSVKPNFADSFAGLSISTSTLSINLNSLYTAPTALATTLSVVGSNVQVGVTDVPTRLFPNGSIAGLTIQGTSGGNSLTLDYAGGIPYGAGVTFSPPAASGGAENALVLQNGTFTQEAYLASGAGKGSLVFPNRQVNGVTIGNQIDFENLTPITDTLTVAGFTFTAPLGSQTVHVTDGPVVSGVQTTQINDGGTSHFELINFANKTSVAINTGTGGDLVAVNLTAPAAGLSSMSISTSGGDDAVAVVSLPASVALSVDTGAGASNDIALSSSGSLAGIQGPVTVRSTGGTATLQLDDTADATGQNFVITPGQVTGGPLGSPVDYSGGGISSVQVRGGSGNDLFTFSNFGSPTTATAYIIDGGPGVDTLTVNSTLPTVNYSTPGILTFGAGQPTINYARIEEINLGQASAPPVGIPVVVYATEAQAFVQRTVARFTDAAPGGPVNYYASIDWGDGSPATGGVIVPTGVTGTYEILGGHSYAAAATSYPVNVTLTRQGGTSTTTTVGGVTINISTGGAANSVPNPIPSTAVVAAAPLSALGIPLVGRATAPLSSTPGGVQIAAFTDSGTNLPPSGYTALIYWGDGSPPTAATQITATGTTGGVVYNVFGDHTYANLGTYPVTVLVTKPPTAVTAPVVAQNPPGAQAIAVSTATILDVPLRTVTGQLNPASDSGASSTDGITNVTQPNYFGLTDSPGASIAVVATPTSGTPILLGTTQSDNSGAWSVTSTAALADGAYTITVYAADHFDASNVVTNALPQTLLIDTVGPKVVNTVFTPKSGYVTVTYQDYGGAANAGSGLNLATVQDPSNYNFTFVSSIVRGYRPPARWLLGPIATTPGTTTGPQEATVLINGGTPIRGGVYQLKITSASPSALGGVQDLAGNALDGEFYGTFPSGNNARGGDFIARLDSIHNTVFAPQTIVGPGKPAKPPVKKPVKVVKTPPVRTPPIRKVPVKVVHAPPAKAAR
ncbi:MAG: Ig-like domain-containing protein [Paludisphaera borealis]|uniref:beta strand repeat-containing protein n=1 Tax=Paludisphaera borealis TaxID=1387353 RepID=UPI00284F5284|nr:Ig-like domain-containing protein [Paludisphaera borealis]MDR3622462.1 Ig-like domain-containing protein [Paludisphaera borealis]